ncbi:MAG TPA: NrsF family protein [Gammaproteobacteria bacterium]|nr:NrsF family protein [Gammaproteobacteria bacterium]
MTKNRNELIAELSRDLMPSRRTGMTIDIIIYWLVFNFTVAMLLIWYAGPFREGSIQQARANPQFLLESIVGLSAIILLAISAVRSGIPSNVTSLKRYTPALLLLLTWLGFYIFGLWSPALEPSMLGKRELLPCYLETVIYGLPSLLMGLYLIGRLWPLHGSWSGLIIGLAAGATPALIMQFACMYIPAHIITHHLIPGLLLGVIGFFAGKYYLSKS